MVKCLSLSLRTGKYDFKVVEKLQVQILYDLECTL